MQNIWFVKIHRKIRDNPIFWKPNYLAVFMYIILDVEFEECKKPLRWDLIKLNPWEGLFFQKEISDKMWISLWTVSNIIKRLNSENIIEIKTTPKYSIIGLVNWNSYQTQVENTSENELKTNWKRTETLKEYSKNTKENRYRAFTHLSLSWDEFQKLIAMKYTQQEIDNVLDSIENYKDNKKYKSLYLTAKKWLDKDKNKESEQSWIEIIKKMQREWYNDIEMNNYLKIKEPWFIKKYMEDKDKYFKDLKSMKIENIDKYWIKINWDERFFLTT